jgi:hypothetical protein
MMRIEMSEKIAEPSENSLIEEYDVLNNAVWKRDEISLLVHSIMISATLGVVTFAIQYRNTLGFIFGLPFAMFVPLFSLVPIAVSYSFLRTSQTVDTICLNRLHEIEKILHIKGHHWVYEQIEHGAMFKFRKYLWDVIFIVFIVAYVGIAIWLLKATATV